jgi:hypothetical protein
MKYAKSTVVLGVLVLTLVAGWVLAAARPSEKSQGKWMVVLAQDECWG